MAISYVSDRAVRPEVPLDATTTHPDIPLNIIAINEVFMSRTSRIKRFLTYLFGYIFDRLIHLASKIANGRK